MELKFSDLIPNIKSNSDGSWPQSAKHKAPRHEVPSGADLVEVPFDLKLGERPGPGRVYIIGLMSGPIGQAVPIGSLAIGAEDQWLVTGHPEIQEPGIRRVVVNWGTTYHVRLEWYKSTKFIAYSIFDEAGRSVHSITIRSSLNLDSGGRILVGQDVKNPKRLKDLHSLPPFGSTITGVISATDDDSDHMGPVEPVIPTPVVPTPTPITPLPTPTPAPTPPPITLPPNPPILPPVALPPIISHQDKILGLDRNDIILILRSLLASFERGEDIDLLAILAQILAPVILNQLLNR